ncbi:hypothetical protein FIBSPDRAFT_1050038 [Athelia psychrophila]|uniref:Uncharacterized protein n=1 Tax=Athelia psychrophila TaxID=1759441 RepID=A0A166B9H5_9AGAM|nr:hypothetical protein FIBSPDRAFT_1050038 [Fibularhizoctonia sp. CBS 109695]
MQKSTPLPLGQSGARTGGGQGAVEAALDEIQWDDWLMSIADDESSHASTSRLWQTECSEEAQQSAHGGVNPDDLLIEAFMSALGQTTPSDMDPLVDFTAAPRKTSIPLPRTSTPVLGECEGQNVAVGGDAATSYMQLCLPGGLASIEGYSPYLVEEPFPDFEQSRWPASTVPTVVPASCRPPFVEADMEFGYLLPSTGREQPVGYPMAEYAYQEPDATSVQVNRMLPTPEPSPMRSDDPSQLDSQPAQPMGRELRFYPGSFAGQHQEPPAGPSRVDYMPLTPDPSPSRPDFPPQSESQPERPVGRELRRPLLVEINGHLFDEFRESSAKAKPTHYHCADIRCNRFGKLAGKRKQECKRHAMTQTAGPGVIVINCAYNWEGCTYMKQRKDKVTYHEIHAHGYHRDGCACRECKAKGI